MDVYARPHQLIDIGGRRLNLFCSGHGSPTVIFDGGLGDDITEWRAVQAPLAKITRACSYDRAGLGFSDPGPKPRTAAALAADLNHLLKKADVRPPYVMVASSLAGLHIRLFTDEHLDEVSGMVLIDPSFEYQVPVYEAATPAYISSAKGQLAKLQSCVDRFRDGPPASGSAAYKNCIGDADPDLPPDVVRALVSRTDVGQLPNDRFRTRGIQRSQFR